MIDKKPQGQIMGDSYRRDVLVILINPATRHIHSCIHPTDEKDHTRFIRHHAQQEPGLVQVIVEDDPVEPVKVVPLV